MNGTLWDFTKKTHVSILDGFAQKGLIPVVQTPQPKGDRLQLRAQGLSTIPILSKFVRVKRGSHRKSEILCPCSINQRHEPLTSQRSWLPLSDHNAFRENCEARLRAQNLKYIVEQKRCSSEIWVRVVQCRAGAHSHVILFFAICCICPSEIPSFIFVVIQRGDHQHDDAGVGSGRIWTPAQGQGTVGTEACFLAPKPTLEGLVGTLHREFTEESVPTRNQNSNCLKRMKKDRAKTSQPVFHHVATAKHTVQEWVQDLVEDDALQLHVIPSNVLTGGTVCVVFANCSMLPGTMPRYNCVSLKEFVFLSCSGKCKVSDRSWHNCYCQRSCRR